MLVLRYEGNRSIGIKEEGGKSASTNINARDVMILTYGDFRFADSNI